MAAPAQAGPSGSSGRRLDEGAEARQPRAPERHDVFVGRATELEHIGAAFDRGGSGRVALVALQGMADVLQAELEGAPFAVPEAELRELVRQVAGLPLALHPAAGYLRRGVTVADSSNGCECKGLALGPREPGDHVRRDRVRGVLSTSFAISRELLLVEAGTRAPTWSAALVALGWAPRKGFGRSLGYRPKTWLLRAGWKRHGSLSAHEVPSQHR